MTTCACSWKIGQQRPQRRLLHPQFGRRSRRNGRSSSLGTRRGYPVARFSLLWTRQRCRPPRSGLCTATTWTSTCPPPGRNTSSCEVPSYVSSSLTATSATQPCRTHIRPHRFAGCAGSWAELKHSSMGWANAAIGFVWTVELVRVKPCRRMFSIQITELANAEAAVAHTSARSMIGHGMRQGCGSMN